MKILKSKINKACSQIKQYIEEIESVTDNDYEEIDNKISESIKQVLNAHLTEYPEIKELTYYSESGGMFLLLDYDSPELAKYPEDSFAYKYADEDIDFDEDTNEKIIYFYNECEEPGKRTYNKKDLDKLLQLGIKEPFIKSLNVFESLLNSIELGDLDFSMKTIERKKENEK